MNTKLLMTTSAFVMGILGVAASFLPEEILTYLGVSSVGIAPLFMQVCGSLYLGFALMNWMGKANLIGGIYSRPVAMANFTHFMIGALALVKGLLSQPGVLALWIAGAVYSLFALCFAIVTFTHPVKANAMAGKV